MNNQANQPATIDIVRKNLGKRYRAERRFRFYGIMAVSLAMLFLSFLFISIIGNGYTAFQQTYLKLDVHFDEAMLDPAGERNPEDLSRANYGGLVKASMRAAFPEVKARREKRDLYSLISTGAAFELREQVLANPDLIGTTQSFWLVADDDVDMYAKGHSTDIKTEAGNGIASPTGTKGRIQVLSTSNDFTEILVDVKKQLARMAKKLERDLGWAESTQAELQRTIAKLQNRLEAAEGDAERTAMWQRRLTDTEKELVAVEDKINRLAPKLADLRKRANTPGGKEHLLAEMPSYMIEINGGLVKATSVSNTGIEGEVFRPLQSTADAKADEWNILVYTTPESDRRLKDKEVTWIEQLRTADALEKRFNINFFTSGDSRDPELSGIAGALMGSLFTLMITLALSFPIGVATAVYLEEFAPKNRWTDLVEVNINNLAAVPSIVFGLLGLAVFINFFGLPRSAPVIGGLVLTLMTLPTIIIASRAALKSVPPSIREAALGVGASRMQAMTHHVLPLALPGMLTGTIIGMAQALGETAPLLMIGMVAFIVDIPSSPFDPSTVLPVQIYLWADSPERAFVERTSAAIMVLLGFLIIMNALAVILRKRFERRW